MTPHNDEFFSNLLEKIKTQPISKKNYLGLAQFKLLSQLLIKVKELKIDVGQKIIKESIEQFCGLACFLKNTAGERQYQAKLQELAELLKNTFNDEASINLIESLIIQELLPTTEQNKTQEDFSKYINWAVNADTRCGNIQDLDRGLYKDNVIHSKYPLEGMRAWLIASFNTAFPYVWATLDQSPTQVEALQGLSEIVDRLLIDKRLQPSLNTGDKQIQHFCYLILFKAKLQLPILDLNKKSLKDNVKILWPANQRHSPTAQMFALQHCLEILQQVTDVESFFKVLNIIISIIDEKLKPIKEQERWPDYHSQLADSRHCFLQVANPVKAQKESTKQTVALLNAFLKESQSLLGIEICQVALLVTGSTSRHDRMPKSDVELVLLHENLSDPKAMEGVKRRQQQSYIYTLAKLIELAIIALNETPYSWEKATERGGFRLESSTSTHFYQDLILPPKILAQQKLYQVVKNDIKELVKSETLLSLLKPILVNPEAQNLFESFNDNVEKFLADTLTIEQQQALEEAFLGKINIHENPKKLIFREAAAFYCWLDVLQKSVELLNAQPIKLLNTNQALPPIDLKKAFYKPLTYLGISLQIYHNWSNELHPHEVFAKASQEKVFSQSVIKLLQVSLESILHLRINLHQKSSKQDDTLQGLPLESKDILTLEIIGEAIIKPLAKNFTERLQGNATFSWKNVMDDMLLAYLTYRRSAFKKWQAFYPDEIAPWHPFLDVLADFPGPDGWSVTMYREEYAWHKKISRLFVDGEAIQKQRKDNNAPVCYIEGFPDFYITKPEVTHYLPFEVTQDLFDEAGQPIPNRAFSSPQLKSKSNSQIHKEYKSILQMFEYEGCAYFIKFKEGDKECLIGREYTVEMIHRLSGGSCVIVPGWPLKLKYTLYNNGLAGAQITHWCWISPCTTGVTLGDVMRENLWRESIDNQLDKISFAQLFGLALKTFPEDQHPRNLLLIEIPDQELPATVNNYNANNNSARKNKNNLLKENKRYQLVSLDNGQSFVQPIRNEKDRGKPPVEILNLKTMVYFLPQMKQELPNEFVEWNLLIDNYQWLTLFKERIQLFNNIFNPLLGEGIPNYNALTEEQKKPYNLVKLDGGILQLIILRQQKLKRFLVKNSKQSAANILQNMDPLVATKCSCKMETLEDFEALDPKSYVVDERFKINPKTIIKHTSTNYRVIEERTLAAFEMALEMGLQDDFFAESIDFNRMRLSDGKFDEAQQRFILKLMLKTKFNQELSLAYCQVFTEKQLEDILKNNKQIKKLNLEGCPQITSKIFQIIQRYCPELENLNLNSTHIAVSQLNITGQQFKQLKVFQLSNCINIKHLRLANLNLKSLILANSTELQIVELINSSVEILNISHCNQLEKLDVNVSDLKHIDLIGCDRLPETNLIEILKTHKSPINHELYQFYGRIGMLRESTFILKNLFEHEIYFILKGSLTNDKKKECEELSKFFTKNVLVSTLNLIIKNGQHNALILLLDRIKSLTGIIADILLKNILEYRNNDGDTALHLAAAAGHASVVEILFSNHAGIEVKNEHGHTPLHFAAMNGHIEVVKKLLEAKAQIEAKNNNEDTALILASEAGHSKVVEALLAAGADKEATNKYGNTALHRAAMNGHIEVIKKLLEAKAQIEAKDNYEDTALILASAAGHNKVVETLLAAGADKEATNKYGNTALHYAAVNGHIEVVKKLLEAKAQIETKNNDEDIALILASEAGHSKVVEALLAAGADKEATNKYGNTALHWAAANGHIEVVKKLLESKAQIEAKNNNEDTALIWASAKGRSKVVEALLAAGADKEAKDKAGNTALHYAAANGHIEVVKKLLEAKAQIEAKNNIEDTALILASEEGHSKVVEALLAAEADKEAKDRAGNTALHCAAVNGHIDVVKKLLEAKAQIEAKNNNEVTALIWASEEGHSKVVEALLAAGADKEAKDKYGNTALHCAAANGHIEVVKKLLESKAQIEAKNNNEDTSLLWVSDKGHTKVVEALIAAGADAAVEDKDGNNVSIAKLDNFLNSILRCAILSKNTTVIELILKHGVKQSQYIKELQHYPKLLAVWRSDYSILNEMIKNQNHIFNTQQLDISPLMLAAYKGDIKMMRYLLKNGSLINEKNIRGDTPLLMAINGSNLDSVKWLYYFGADLENVNCFGNNALLVAGINKQASIIRWLSKKPINLDAINHECKSIIMFAAEMNSTFLLIKLINRGAKLAGIDIEGNNALTLALKGNCYEASVLLFHYLPKFIDINNTWDNHYQIVTQSKDGKLKDLLLNFLHLKSLLIGGRYLRFAKGEIEILLLANCLLQTFSSFIMQDDKSHNLLINRFIQKLTNAFERIDIRHCFEDDLNRVKKFEYFKMICQFLIDSNKLDFSITTKNKVNANLSKFGLFAQKTLGKTTYETIDDSPCIVDLGYVDKILPKL